MTKMLATRRHRTGPNDGRRLAPVDSSLTLQNRRNDHASCPGGPIVAPVEGLIQVLRQLAEVIAGLSPEQYTAGPVGVATSSIGCHVRHCLEHVNAFLEGIEAGRLNYDARQRGTSIEHDRHAAFELILQMEDQLWEIDAERLFQPVSVKVMPTTNGPAYSTPSSVGRELAFVQSHTIHHGAIIAMTCKMLGADVPETFGYAPATIAYLEKTACVPLRSSGSKGANRTSLASDAA